MLKAEIQAEILALHFGNKKSARAISKELGIDRKSVAQVIRRRTVAFTPLVKARGSIVDPYMEQILELLKKDPWISASTVHQHIRNQGFMGGIRIVRTRVSKLRKFPNRKREAFLKLEFSPGECAQVDWGEFGDVFSDGTKIHCFVMVLCYSRLLYIEFTRSEKFEDFIRCHENAFQYFNKSVPLECWYDNLATAVTERMGSLVKFNSKFMGYMGHHAIRPHACNPARGNEKGRVEDGVKYIRSSFWAGRVFKDFEALTTQANLWRDNIANQREHRTTRKIPVLLFDAEERATLRAMNPHPFDTAETLSRVVPPQCHVQYEGNHYSVPWTLVGLSITLKVNEKQVTLFYKDQCVAVHNRIYKKNQTVTNKAHIQGLLERKPGQSSSHWQLNAVKAIGPRLARYIDLIQVGQRSLKSELSQILALTTIYGEAQVNEAVSEVLSLGIVGVDNLERTLKARRTQEGDEGLLPRPITFQNENLNRVIRHGDLRKYDATLFENNPTRKEEKNESNTSTDPCTVIRRGAQDP